MIPHLPRIFKCICKFCKHNRHFAQNRAHFAPNKWNNFRLCRFFPSLSALPKNENACCADVFPKPYIVFKNPSRLAAISETGRPTTL